MTTKQSINEEFEKKFKENHLSDNIQPSPKIIQSFYDAQIQELLNDIMPNNKSDKAGRVEYCFDKGFNHAIQEIKEKIRLWNLKIR